MRIPELKINPQIVWNTLGPNQYIERPLLPITIRELVQNSSDAILASGRNDGEITITYDHNQEDIIRIICEDNGIGMDEDTLLDKFLCLGESEKSYGAVGGFGIAKAAIIGACSKWEIYSRDNYLSSEMLGKSPISKIDFLDGTIIILEYHIKNLNDDLYPSENGFYKGCDYIKFSNLNCKINMISNYYGKINDGLSNYGEYESKEIVDNKYFKITSLKFKNNSRYHNGCKIFYRLNGLVQFKKEISRNVTDLMFIVDIKTNKTPRDLDYPFGPSRETISKKIEFEINKIIEPFIINNVSGLRSFNEKYHEIDWFKGNLIGEGKNKEEGFYYSSIPRGYTGISLIPRNKENIVEYEFIVRKVNNAIKIDPMAENNRKLLIAWAEILKLTASVSGVDKYEKFGIGFILDENTVAERFTIKNKIFYLINPKFMPISKPQELIPKLIFEACHEISHSFHKDHNEDFTITHSDIFRKVYSNYTKIKWIRKFLRDGAI